MKNIGRLFLGGYIILLLWGLLFKFSISQEMVQSLINPIAGTSRLNLSPFLNNGGMREMIFNLATFIPLGILLQLVSRRKAIIKLTFVVLGISLLIESSQYFLGLGVFDITDLILNTVGGIVGIVMYQLFCLMLDKAKVDKFVLFVATGGVLAFLFFSIYAYFILGFGTRYLTIGSFIG